MSIDTRKAQGRRTVHYASVDEILADAERFAAGPARTLGNWSQGQIYQHLAEAMHASIDGMPFQPPLPIRILGRLFKPLILRYTMPPGYRLPEQAGKLLPPPVSVDQGLDALRAARARLRRETQRCISPLVGKLTPAQWDQLHCRHAEMHMSFLVSA